MSTTIMAAWQKNFVEHMIKQNNKTMKNVYTGPKPYQVLTDAEKARALESQQLACYLCRKNMKLLRSERKPEFYCADCHISAPVWGKDVRMSRRWEEDEILGNHPPANPGFKGRMGDLT